MQFFLCRSLLQIYPVMGPLRNGYSGHPFVMFVARRSILFLWGSL